MTTKYAARRVYRVLSMIGTAASTTVLAAPSLASAQSTSATRLSPLRGCCALGYTEWDVDTASSLWRVAANAADIARSMPRRAESVWRRSQVTLSHNAGSSYRPQEAAATSTAELVAEGGQSRGRWSTYGRVGYERRQDRDVRWRHTADAYDGMQYQWADSIGGTFGRDVLTISTAFASPAWRGWRAGMSSTLGLGPGARQNDPRPLTRRRIAEWAPGLKWTRGRQTLGVSYQREWLREDLEVGGGTSSEYPSIFRLRGMVTFDRTQLISGERALFATGNGGTMAYAYEGTTWTTATWLLVPWKAWP